MSMSVGDRELRDDLTLPARTTPAPDPVVYANLGFTPENVAGRVRRLVKP